MLANERFRIICNKISMNGQVIVTDLAKELGVSDETIRRDISVLHQQNKIRKVHGGAVSVCNSVYEENYDKRMEENREERKVIGQYCAQLIYDNDTIAIDTGVTIDAMLHALYDVKGVTILTPSIAAVNILMEKRKQGDFSGKIILIGGEVDVKNNCAGGALAVQMLMQFSVDKAFIAATAVSDDGPYMYKIDEAMYTKQLIEKSKLTYLLATSNKFMKNSLYKICDFNMIDNIITDDKFPINSKLEEKINSENVKIHVVKSM